MKKGFTLIELMVVIAIIGILGVVITPVVGKAIEKAKVARTISDLGAINTAADNFYIDTGRFPCNKSGGWGKDPGFTKLITASNCWAVEGGCALDCLDIAGWDGPYLKIWHDSPWRGEDLLAPGYQGAYNWNYVAMPRPDGGSCWNVVSLEDYGGVPDSALEKIDTILDDGNLLQGSVFIRGDPANPDYLVYEISCEP
jgi:general secretion pathway protein G